MSAAPRGMTANQRRDGATRNAFVGSPIERIEDVPQTAVDDGEGTNLWRHFLLGLPSGRRLLFYNSGPYFREQLFCKIADDAP